jgi:hypothetical protein
MAIISVRAEGEHGELHREAPGMYVLEEVFGKALKEENLLWIPQIDPYGDTVLNRIQLSGFLDEWRRLFQYATSEEQRQALLAVQQLAEFCLESPHRYLRFFGD